MQTLIVVLLLGWTISSVFQSAMCQCAASNRLQLEFNLWTANKKPVSKSRDIRILKFSFLALSRVFWPLVELFFGLLSFSTIITVPVQRASDFTSKSLLILSLMPKVGLTPPVYDMSFNMPSFKASLLANSRFTNRVFEVTSLSIDTWIAPAYV